MSFAELPRLSNGDAVVLVAPARWVDEELVDVAERWLHDAGLLAVRAPHLLAREGQLAGSDTERQSDLQWAFDHREAKAILAMRGGYGSHRCLDGLDMGGILASPKIFSGFSDMTAIHMHLQSHGLRSVHCAMPSTFSGNTVEAKESLLAAWKYGQSVLEWRVDRPDVLIQGRLFGGNLSVLHSLLATSSWPDMQGGILFIEDLDEMLYHVDRMLYHFHRAGVFRGLHGVLVGGMSDMRDNTKAYGFSSENPFGRVVEDTLVEVSEANGVPLILHAPAGHISDNRALVLGSKVEVLVQGGCASLSA